MSKGLGQSFIEIYVTKPSFGLVTMIGRSAGSTSLASGDVMSISTGGAGLMAATSGGIGTRDSAGVHACSTS